MKGTNATLATLVCGLLAAPGGVLAQPGRAIEAEALAPLLSANYEIAAAETVPGLRYVGYFDEGSFLCYESVDLTGVRSVELHYARDSDEPGRYAVVAAQPDGRRINLGERDSVATGGWETYAPRRIGLARELDGVHTLCLYGVTGGGIFNLDRFVLSDRPGEHEGVTVDFETSAPPTLSAAGHDFTLERVAGSPLELWAMAFLPDGTLVATQKNGELLVAGEDRRLQRVEGTPAVWNRGPGCAFRAPSRSSAGCSTRASRGCDATTVPSCSKAARESPRRSVPGPSARTR